MRIMKNIILYSPPIVEHNIKISGTIDGELLYLGQFFYNNYNVKIVDDFYMSKTNKLSQITKYFNPQYIIIHLWKESLLREHNIDNLLIYLQKIKQKNTKIKILAFGSIAVSLNSELITNSNNVIDTVISNNKFWGQYYKIIDNIKSYYHSQIKFTEDYINSLNLKTTNISIYSSRGCDNNCSFCHYNSDFQKWKSRDIKNVISDIKLLNHLLGIKRISFFDSNFGTKLDNNEDRITKFIKHLKILNLDISISLNISLSFLNKSILEKLSPYVDIILVGIESFNQNSLNIYHKKQNISYSIKMINYAQNVGIFPVVSYILFHPWLTFDDFKKEINSIEIFGRNKIVHFLSKSILYVMPNTTIEKKIKKDNLLIKNGFERTFVFKDKIVNDIYIKLKLFFESNYSKYNKSYDDLAKLKLLEWNFLKKLINSI